MPPAAPSLRARCDAGPRVALTRMCFNVFAAASENPRSHLGHVGSNVFQRFRHVSVTFPSTFPSRFRQRFRQRFRYVSVAFPLRFRQRFRRVSVNVSIAFPLGNCLPDKCCPKTPAAPTKSAMTNTALHKTAVRKTAARKTAARLLKVCTTPSLLLLAQLNCLLVCVCAGMPL